MKHTPRAFLATVVVGTLALAGCSSGGGDQSGQSGPSNATESGDTASEMPALSDINPMDRSELAEGGTLRLAIADWPSTFNTLNVNGNTVDMASVMALFISPQSWLYQEDGTFEVNPNFMESYTTEVVDDKQVVDLKLNPKAVWGDGTPITVADYEATWKACNGENEEYNCAATDGFRDMESVEQGANEFEVKVTFKSVFPDWSASLSTVYPAAGIGDAETFNEGWAKPNDAYFAGPLHITKVDDAQQVITLERNPKWWGEPALLDSVTLKTADPSATATAFANGELDVLSGIIDGAQYSQAASRSDAEVRRAGGLQWRHFTFNSESGVLKDAALRLALTRGIDRASIAAADLAGIPDLDPNELLLGNHFFMPGQEGYQDNSGVSAYDPEKAKADLDGLGWVLEEGAEYRTKDGATLEFDYTMMPDVSTSKTEGEMFQAQMKEIGVKVNISNVESTAFFDDYIIPGEFSTATFAWQGTPYPLANIGQLYGCTSDSNYAKLCVKEIEDLIPKVASTADIDARNELANEVDQLVWENVAFFPIYRRLEMTATASNLANYGAFGMSSIAPENVGFTK